MSFVRSGKFSAILICSLFAISSLLVGAEMTHSVNAAGPTITTTTPFGVGFGGNYSSPSEQVISTNPLTPGEMTIEGRLQTSGCPGCPGFTLMGWHTANYWATNNLVNVSFQGFFDVEDGEGAYSANGTNYLGFWRNQTALGVGGGDAYAFRIAKSSNGNTWGLTRGWIFQNNVTFAEPNGTSIYLCEGLKDQPTIWVDNSASSGFANRVYVATNTYFSATPTNTNCTSPTISGVAFESSSDGGNTWTNLKAFPKPYMIELYNHAVTTSVNGTLYLGGTELNLPGATCLTGGEVVYRSMDGGATFTYHCLGVPNTFGTSPVIATNGRSTIFDVFGNSSSLLISVSKDSGTSWSTPIVLSSATNSFPYYEYMNAAVSTSGRLDISWIDFRNSPVNSGGLNFTQGDLFYVYSTNSKFTTFSSPIRITTNGPYNFCSQFYGGNDYCQAGNDFFGMTETTSGHTSLVYISWSRSSTSSGGGNTYSLYLTKIQF